MMAIMRYLNLHTNTLSNGCHVAVHTEAQANNKADSDAASVRLEQAPCAMLL
jgi:hypothetical protein